MVLLLIVAALATTLLSSGSALAFEAKTPAIAVAAPAVLNAIFAATGVTWGNLLEGVVYKDGFVHTHTLVMNSATGTVREVRMKRKV